MKIIFAVSSNFFHLICLDNRIFLLVSALDDCHVGLQSNVKSTLDLHLERMAKRLGDPVCAGMAVCYRTVCHVAGLVYGVDRFMRRPVD